MNHSHQTVCLTRGYLFCFCLLITLGYSPRVDWESGIGVIAIGAVQRTSRWLALSSTIIWSYMFIPLCSASCSGTYYYYMIIMRDSVVRLYVLRILLTGVSTMWSTVILWLVISWVCFDHVHCRLFVSSLIIIFYHCAVRYYRLWKILISLRDSYSRRVPSLSSGAC